MACSVCTTKSDEHSKKLKTTAKFWCSCRLHSYQTNFFERWSRYVYGKYFFMLLEMWIKFLQNFKQQKILLIGQVSSSYFTASGTMH